MWRRKGEWHESENGLSKWGREKRRKDVREERRRKERRKER